MPPLASRWVALLVSTSLLQATAMPAFAQAPHPSGAQPSTNLIERGRQLFDDQRYEESIQTLSGALVHPNLAKDQRLEMYRLLALDHITLGDTEEAENFVRALLGLDPDYALPKTESPRFRNFFASVRAKWEAEGKPGIVTEQVGAQMVAIRHSSPIEGQANAPIVLTALVEDPEHSVASVRLFFRGRTAGKYSEETTQFDPVTGAVRAIFPASAVRPPFVAYYFMAKDKNGVPLAASGDPDAPLRIPVPDEAPKWLFPVVIGGGIVALAGIVLGALAAGGAFSKGK